MTKVRGTTVNALTPRPRLPVALPLLLCLLVSVFLGATTYPFHFNVPAWISNGVQLRPGSAVFPRAGIATNSQPPGWIEEVIAENRIGIHLVVQSAASNQTGPARIFTLSRDPYERNLTIGQEGSDLIIRLRRGSETPNGIPAFIVPDVFADLRVRRIQTEVRNNELVVLVDGTEMLRSTMPQYAFQYWDKSHLIALGNEHTWNRAWLGAVHEAQVLTPSSSIDLLEHGVLVAPAFSISSSQIVWISSSLLDLSLNFLVLLPVGFLSARCFFKHIVRRVFVFWLPVVIVAEGAQLFIEGRYSSLSDLALNMAGVTLGAVVANKYKQQSHCRPTRNATA